MQNPESSRDAAAAPGLNVQQGTQTVSISDADPSFGGALDAVFMMGSAQSTADHFGRTLRAQTGLAGAEVQSGFAHTNSCRDAAQTKTAYLSTESRLRRVR